MLFEELGLDESICRSVRAEGYTSPTDIQAQAIPPILAGSDLLASARTGTGKTAAFALPVLQRLMLSAEEDRARRSHRRAIRALVLSPTRELAQQTEENFRVYGRHTGLYPTAIVGGVRQNQQTNALRRGVDIVVATPGRLLDLMEQGYVDLSRIEMFVMDEADQMLDMGFVPDIRRILAQVPRRRQTLFFSATLPSAIMSLAYSMLTDPVELRLGDETVSKPLVTQAVYKVAQHHKVDLLHHLLATSSMTRTLIFTRTKRGADDVVRHLRDANIRAESIHSDKSQSARQRSLENFRASKTSILVATDIAARGIDVDGISHVLNYDLPELPETYVHRIGRTGRAGAEGTAVSFCDAREQKYLKAIERHLTQPIKVEQDHPMAAPGRPSSHEPKERSKPPRQGTPRTKAKSASTPPKRGARYEKSYQSRARRRRSAERNGAKSHG